MFSNIIDTAQSAAFGALAGVGYSLVSKLYKTTPIAKTASIGAAVGIAFFQISRAQRMLTNTLGQKFQLRGSTVMMIHLANNVLREMAFATGAVALGAMSKNFVYPIMAFSACLSIFSIIRIETIRKSTDDRMLTDVQGYEAWHAEVQKNRANRASAT